MNRSQNSWQQDFPAVLEAVKQVNPDGFLAKDIVAKLKERGFDVHASAITSRLRDEQENGNLTIDRSVRPHRYIPTPKTENRNMEKKELVDLVRQLDRKVTNASALKDGERGHCLTLLANPKGWTEANIADGDVSSRSDELNTIKDEIEMTIRRAQLREKLLEALKKAGHTLSSKQYRDLHRSRNTDEQAYTTFCDVLLHIRDSFKVPLVLIPPEWNLTSNRTDAIDELDKAIDGAVPLIVANPRRVANTNPAPVPSGTDPLLVDKLDEALKESARLQGDLTTLRKDHFTKDQVDAAVSAALTPLRQSWKDATGEDTTPEGVEKVKAKLGEAATAVSKTKYDADLALAKNEVPLATRNDLDRLQLEITARRRRQNRWYWGAAAAAGILLVVAIVTWSNFRSESSSSLQSEDEIKIELPPVGESLLKDSSSEDNSQPTTQPDTTQLEGEISPWSVTSTLLWSSASV